MRGAHGDAVRVLSFIFITAQKDTRNREYLISWLLKISLKQLLFQYGTFSEPLVFKDIYILERASLFILLITTSLVNFRELRRSLPRDSFTTFACVSILCLRN